MRALPGLADRDMAPKPAEVAKLLKEMGGVKEAPFEALGWFLPLLAGKAGHARRATATS